MTIDLGALHDTIDKIQLYYFGDLLDCRLIKNLHVYDA